MGFTGSGAGFSLATLARARILLHKLNSTPNAAIDHIYVQKYF